MILSEQIIKRLSKIYWHGSTKNNDSSSNCFYLSTAIEYALRYARPNPKVTEVTESQYLTSYKLNTDLNLFNARCKKDIRVFERFCRVYSCTNLLRYVEGLKHWDWLRVLGSDRKTAFIESLREIGYDGFTNIESKAGTIYRYSGSGEDQFGFSGIGIFDISKLTKLQQFYKWKNIKKIPELEDCRWTVQGLIGEEILENKNNSNLLNLIWSQTRVNQLFTKKEILDIIEHCKKDTIGEQTWFKKLKEV